MIACLRAGCRRRLLAAGSLVLVMGAGAAARGSEWTPEAQRQVRALTSAFNDPFRPAEDRARMAERLLQLGEPGAAALASAVDTELARALPAYEEAFERSVAAFLRSETREHAGAIREHRRTLQQLRQRRNLSREDITGAGDAALEALRRILLPSASDVLGADERLASARQRIERLSGWKEAAHRILARAPVRGRQELEDREREMAGVALYRVSRGEPVLRHNLRQKGELSEAEWAGVRETNLTRMLAGLNPLRIDPRLCVAARDHSKDMHTLNFFAHESPVAGKREFTDRARRAGTSARAENIFRGSTRGEAAVRGWWTSPGHHRSLMEPSHGFVGLGHHEGNWTQKLR